MEYLSVRLPMSGRLLQVRVERKRMKNCRIRVYADQSVALSAPCAVSLDRLQEFLEQSAPWIEGKLKKFAEAAGERTAEPAEGGETVRDGATVRLLGGQRRLSVQESRQNRIFCGEETICIESRTISDQKKLQSQFDRWWRKEALRYLERRVDELFPIVGKYGTSRPEICVRRMRTLWGSCNVTRGKITFSLNLIGEAPECIDYVVLHELAHLIHPNHSRQFYDFIGLYMPDWKQRREKLKRR